MEVHEAIDALEKLKYLLKYPYTHVIVNTQIPQLYKHDTYDMMNILDKNVNSKITTQ